MRITGLLKQKPMQAGWAIRCSVTWLHPDPVSQDAKNHRPMNPIRQQQVAATVTEHTAAQIEMPAKASRSWSKRKAVIITALALVGYVPSYQVYVILAYFNYINSDHGIGRVLDVLFIPLGYLEQHSETVRAFFRWLTDLLIAPFL